MPFIKESVLPGVAKVCQGCSLHEFPLKMRYCPTIKVTNGAPKADNAPLASLNPTLITLSMDDRVITPLKYKRLWVSIEVLKLSWCNAVKLFDV